MKKTTFVLSDESVNSYGFRVLTTGIELEQFRKNPLMLYLHDAQRMPIGRWENLRQEGDRLLADAVFDMGDPFAAEVARKVEGGVIRCCSIGFDIIELSDDPALMLPEQRQPTVSRSRLVECSICPLGANPGALKLKAGEHMTLSYRSDRNNRSNLSNLSDRNNQTIINQKSNIMDMNEQELAQMRQELADLRQQNQTLAQERDTLRQAAQQARDNEIDGLLSAAVADGRIAEASRPHWDKLMHADLDSGKAVLSVLATRTSLSQQLKEQGKSEFAGKSWNELDRAGRLAAYKEQDPDGFRSLYKQTFGAEYVG